ncbi:MAG: 50S ribosomal protein L17 [Chloroflexi bacterium]|nr:50S ribosomal protein L17 [Chloroflexota bacterium]MCI0580471.1 50S ribosomal protein L17 [Chloroflexota bacterium]MCI0649215.1 50S ribosomal protein L17 [Chloroflexota bacterium]MCI0727973.1 50S ribosomal protein L17 [Chloroflexota bacterium]
MHGRRLSRDSSERKALRKNLIADLICHEKVMTTEAKARMLRPAAEKVITLAKRGLSRKEKNPASEIHARRLAAARVARFRTIKDEDGKPVDVDVVRKLFEEVAPRYMERPGGYTRLVKIGKRPGDNADMAVLMLVEDE